MYATICIILIGNLPQLLNNKFFSELTNIIIISILAIITFNVRKTIFANKERNEEVY